MPMTPEQLFELLSKPDRFTLEDLRRLRQGLLGASASFSRTENAVWLNSRLSVETIDSLVELNGSIRNLDASTGKLVKTTNKLTTYILLLTGVGLIVALVQLVLFIASRHS